ncbi:MAG: choice-of-anchor F family protein [Planctomycetota bacterium]
MGQAYAGEIIALNWFSGIGSVAGEIIVSPSSPGNDDIAGPSPNVMVIEQKAYDDIGPVDLEFTVVDNDGTTEYRFREGVNNGTGVDWTGYRLELGFGVGADFTPSPSGDELDFDAPDYNSVADFTLFFATTIENEDVLLATDGLMPAGAFSFPPFEFTVDVPNGIERFTIRQTPIPERIPEPATGLLVIIGGTCLLRRRRSRRYSRYSR